MFVIFAELFGLAFFAILLTQVNTVNDVLGSETQQLNEQKNDVVAFLKHHEVPKPTDPCVWISTVVPHTLCMVIHSGCIPFPPMRSAHREFVWFAAERHTGSRLCSLPELPGYRAERECL
jgi:hypothetical protein